MKLSKIKRDVNLSENGVWVTNAYGDMDILIASAKNKKYLEMLRKECKPYERQIRQGTISDEKFSEIVTKCIAATVLLGWRNMQDDAGNDITYSPAKAVELLSDPENVDFSELVMALSEEAEVFRKESVETASFQA